ncbi:hypothetical protein YPPY32_2109, partial [Yersinia pestis PY-32]|jgi:hypothetical protein
MREA